MALAVAMAASGCLGDDGFQGFPDAGAPIGTLYDDPSDFDLSACEGDPVDSIDPRGFWNIQIGGEPTPNETARKLRVDGDEAGLTGYLGGQQLGRIELEAGVLFLRASVDPDLAEAAAFCGVGPDGRLVGRHASCFATGCYENDATAYPVDRLDEPEADGVALLAEWRGPPDLLWRDVELVRHRGEVLHVLTMDGLRRIDLADPAAPVELGWLPAGSDRFLDLAFPPGDGPLVYLAAGERGIVIADLSDPSSPVELGTFPDAPEVYRLAADGDRLYALAPAAVLVFDIANPGAPASLSELELDVSALAVANLAALDGVVYLLDVLNGLGLVDLTDPAAPVELGAIGGADALYGQSSSIALTSAGGRALALTSQEHFDGRVVVVDVAPGAPPAEIASYQTRPQVPIRGLTVAGDLAVVAHQQDGLRLLDLSDPASPIEVGHFASFRGTGPEDGRWLRDGAVAADVDLERGLVLLADASRGLLVLSLDENLGVGSDHYRPRPNMYATRMPAP